MPHDAMASQIEKDIIEIEEEIKAIEKVLNRLKTEKEHMQRLLTQHLQRNREKGVKY